jgi:hypothetical protein
VLFSNSSLDEDRFRRPKIPKFPYFLVCKATMYAKRAW